MRHWFLLFLFFFSFLFILSATKIIHAYTQTYIKVDPAYRDANGNIPPPPSQYAGWNTVFDPTRGGWIFEKPVDPPAVQPPYYDPGYYKPYDVAAVPTPTPTPTPTADPTPVLNDHSLKCDFDKNGKIDIFDFKLWKEEFILESQGREQQWGRHPGADCDGDGKTTIFDFNLWKEEFIKTQPV